MDRAFQHFLFKWGAWSLADRWLNKGHCHTKMAMDPKPDVCRAWNQSNPGKHVCDLSGHNKPNLASVQISRACETASEKHCET